VTNQQPHQTGHHTWRPADWLASQQTRCSSSVAQLARSTEPCHRTASRSHVCKTTERSVTSHGTTVSEQSLYQYFKLIILPSIGNFLSKTDFSSLFRSVFRPSHVSIDITTKGTSFQKYTWVAKLTLKNSVNF